MHRILEYISLFILLVVLQLFVFDKISFWGIINPYVYIMFIIMLPMETRGWAVLLLGFFTGAVMDILSGGGGLHTMVTTWLAFIRPIALHFTAGKEAVQAGGIPLSSTIGQSKFFGYLGLTTLMFYIPFCLIEVMSVENIATTLLRIVCSSLTTIVIIYFFQLPFNRGINKKRAK